MIFEIHITVNEFLIEVAKPLGHKLLILKLLDKDLNSLGIQFMTSIQKEFDSYDECLKWTLDTADKYRETVKVERVKIECPVYKDFIDQSLYIECHWKDIKPNNTYHISQRIGQPAYLMTDRVYDKADYLKFYLTHSKLDRELELCLYDDNIRLDKDWIDPGVPSDQNSIIWGKGWYAIYVKDQYHWDVSPIEFFDKHEHCPDGWEWDIPEGMTEEDLEEFVDEHGCEPTAPEGFDYCMESTFEAKSSMSYEDQKKAVEKAGFVIKEYKW